MNTATESIYNLIPKPQQEIKKEPLYRSKYDPKAPLTGSTFGLHGTTVTVGKGINELKKTNIISTTFGPTPKGKVADPSNFLRKGSRLTLQQLKKQNNHSHENDETDHHHDYKNCKQETTRYNPSQKPPVPSKDDKPIMGLKTCKNFITANAVEAILQPPKNVGDSEPHFMSQENYGVVPKYLSKVKEEIEHERKIVDKYIRQKISNNRSGFTESNKNCSFVSGAGNSSSNSNSDCKYEIMEEEDKNALINALKRKWDYVNSKYQKICHRTTIDSLGDIKRKEEQEAELQQLEDDIERLSKPGPLYVKIG